MIHLNEHIMHARTRTYIHHDIHTQKKNTHTRTHTRTLHTLRMLCRLHAILLYAWRLFEWLNSDNVVGKFHLIVEYGGPEEEDRVRHQHRWPSQFGNIGQWTRRRGFWLGIQRALDAADPHEWQGWWRHAHRRGFGHWWDHFPLAIA